MRNRTVTLLLVIAMAMAAFIYLVEKKAPSTDEKKSRRNHVFQTCRKTAIDRVTLDVPGEPSLVLERVSTVAQGGERWAISAPGKYRADASVMSEILSAFDFLTIERRVRDDAKKAQYGFGAPRVTGAFHMGAEAVSFAIGGDDPSSDFVYVRVAGKDDEFYAVHQEFLTSLARRVDDVRDRHLLDRPLSEATAVTLGDFSLRRVPVSGRWEVGQGDAWMAADTGQVNELLDGLTRLKAARFLNEPPPANEAAPTAAVVLGDATYALFLGDACDDGQRRFWAKGDSEVACVSADVETWLLRPWVRYVARTPLPLSADSVERITLKKNDRTLVLARTPEALWQVAGRTPKETDQLRVAEFIDHFADTRAAGLLRDIDTDALQRTTPLAQVTFAGDSGQGEVVLRLYPPEVNAPHTDDDTAATLLRLRRGDEPVLLQVLPALGDAIRPWPLAFAVRELRHCDPSDLREVSRQGALAERLVRPGDDWEIAAPAALPVHAHAVHQLASLLCETAVSDFVEPAQVPPQSFAGAPWLTLKGQRDTGADVVLEIGAPAPDGGRYARFADTPETVFVLDAASLASADRPALSLDRLAVNTDQTRRIAFSHGSRTYAVQREAAGADWQPESGTEIDGAGLARLLVDWGALRAKETVAWGNAVDKPSLTIEFFEPETAAPIALHFGSHVSPSGQPDPAHVRVWKSAENATWLIAARWLNDALALLP